MVRSRARGAREDLAFMLGSDILRCTSCGRRFLCFLRFSFQSIAPSGYGNTSQGFMVVWFAILAGLLFCMGIALWTLRRFHRWPF
jgi:hypothetical protein